MGDKTKDLALTGALAGLEVLKLEDRTRYRAAIQGGAQMGWGYYFPYLLLQNNPGRRAMLIAEDSGSLCVFRWRLEGGEPHLDLYLPPIPFDPAVLRRCLERANDFNSDRSAQVLRVDAHEAALLENDGTLRVRPRKEQYIFASKEYQALSGQKYQKIRYNVNCVERLGVEVLPFSAIHAEACQNLLERWSQQHRETHGTTGGVGISKRAIELAVAMSSDDLLGEVVFIEGKLVGFAFGGEIRPGLACSLERKCDTSVRGLGIFQLRSLLLRLRNFDLVNDGSDCGRSGLKQMKESFRPIQMHTEYRVAQRAKVKVSVGGASRKTVPASVTVSSEAPASLNGNARRIGLLCNCKQSGDPVAKLSPSLLNRAILLGEELARDGIEVLLFSPRRVQANGDVKGYLVKGRDVEAVSTQIPQINANWTYATRKMINRGMGYERFKRWTAERSIEVYVPYELSELLANKRDTYELVSKFDPTLHPRTEELDGSAEQVETFLQRSGLVFVKPRAGHKGDRIFVLRRLAATPVAYSLKHYHKGICRLLEPITIGAAMSIIEIAATETPFVIQEGIESLRFRGSVFDVRVVMVNDGSQWHSIFETRVAPLGSDLSNNFQGGSIHVTEELLETELGREAGQAILENIRRVSHKVADYLESRFPGRVMELGLDLVIDRDRGIHLVEVNAKPGLSGWASERKIFDWKAEDQAYYDRSVRPHIHHLANFLRAKVERSSPSASGANQNEVNKLVKGGGARVER
jgi:hypothetical protein